MVAKGYGGSGEKTRGVEGKAMGGKEERRCGWKEEEEERVREGKEEESREEEEIEGVSCENEGKGVAYIGPIVFLNFETFSLQFVVTHFCHCFDMGDYFSKVKIFIEK